MRLFHKNYNSLSIKPLPLQMVLIVPFLLQIFAAVSLVGYLSFKNGEKVVNDLADQFMIRTTSQVALHLNSYLSIPHTVNQINADAISMGLLDVGDRQKVGKYFWKQMQAYNLSYIGIGLTTGEGVGAARYDGTNVTIDEWNAETANNGSTYATDNQGNRTEIINTYDWNNSAENWYTEPLKAGKPIWSRIFIWDDANSPYITASAGRPIYDAQNQLLGMIGADIHLLKLSDFLRRLDIGKNSQVFIIERNGLLIANSSTAKPYTVEKSETTRLLAVDSPDQNLQGISKSIQQTFNGFQSITEPQKLQLNWSGNSHYVHILPWRDEYGLDWLVVVCVPENAFMAQINANTRTTTLLCLGALVLAIIIGYFTSHHIARPILRVNQATQAMASGNLNQSVDLTNIQELNTLAYSFNYMAGQLRESFTALENSKAELENRVEERTIELKNAFIELQRTQAQVIQSEKMSSLGQLVAGVAHEINNPVNFIHGNIIHLNEYIEDLTRMIQLYQERHPGDDPEVEELAAEIDLEFLITDLQKMLSSIKMGTERIRTIVLSLRNFSRIDEAEFKAVDIHEGIESTLLILQHRLKQNRESGGISVIREYGNLPAVECYPGQLNQVFMNILVNAMDAVDESNIPGKITITTKTIDSQWIEIAIADNGGGISASVKERIFDPFFTTKPIGKGTGMGLAISYRIIMEKHHGKLDCFSHPGEGTQFIIQLPVKQEEGKI